MEHIRTEYHAVHQQLISTLHLYLTNTYAIREILGQEGVLAAATEYGFMPSESLSRADREEDALESFLSLSQ